MKAIRTRRKATPNLESKSQAFFPKTSAVMRKKDAFFNSAVRKKANEEEKVASKSADEKEQETTGSVQKKGEDEKEKINKKEADDDRNSDQKVMSRKAGSEPVPISAEENASVTDAFESELKQSSSIGNSLPDDVKTEMETKFGQTFDEVRIHTDDEASRLCKMIHAKAFTHRYDIYFDSGTFNPESPEGKNLLAHELTHVIQQS